MLTAGRGTARQGKRGSAAAPRHWEQPCLVPEWLGGMDLEETIQPFPGQTVGTHSPQRGSHRRASVKHLALSPVPRLSCTSSPGAPPPAAGPCAPQTFHCIRSSLLQQKLQKPWKLLVSAKPKLNCIHSIKFSYFKLAFFGSTLPATS